MTTPAFDCTRCNGSGCYECVPEPTAAKEWREEYIKNTVNTVTRMSEAMYVSREARNADIKRTISVAMQTLLNQHSAHLVEREREAIRTKKVLRRLWSRRDD